MGRSPTTIFIDSTPFEQQALPSNPVDLNSGQNLALLESARAFTIMQRTVTEIYTKRSVSLGLLQHLTEELRAASYSLPDELRNVPAWGLANRQHILRNAVVACNYYFSMMVLSRPFLVTSIHVELSRASASSSTRSHSVQFDDQQLHGDVLQGAMTSVESATCTIRLIHDLLRARVLFNNMPLMT